MIDKEFMDAERWEGIVEHIQENKCILFLGEGLIPKLSMVNVLCDIVEKKRDYVRAFHKQDGFLVLNELGKSNENLFQKTLKNAFQIEGFKNSTLEKLAEIPFNLIISVTPSMFLNTIFTQKSLNFQKGYYKAYEPKSSFDKITQDNPLLYQILGSVEDTESLIFSQERFFKLTESINKNNDLPDVIVNAFSKTKNIIFLGFEFEKWYFQTLLHLLKINSGDRLATKASNSHFEWQTFYEAQFKINFINQDIDKFVNELHQKFTPEQLRRPVENKKISKRIYKKDNIFKLLRDFQSNNFEAFCEVYFSPLKNDFTNGTEQIQRITMLISYVERYEQFEKLLTDVKDWLEDSYQYKKFEPYYEEI